MKQHILPAIKLTLVSFILLVVIYPAAVWGIAQFAAPNKGGGDLSNVGQAFTNDKYFYSRPSAVAYNAAGSCGSNKGPSNPAYLAEVEARIDTFLVHNPKVNKKDIPSELVTASGSGLDPHISPTAALVQVKRIAEIRKIDGSKIIALVKENTEKPFLGLFGTPTVNLLKLNTALDKL